MQHDLHVYGVHFARFFGAGAAPMDWVKAGRRIGRVHGQEVAKFGLRSG
jgi:hypothetical protein